MDNTLLRKIRRHFTKKRSRSTEEIFIYNLGIITINDCPSRKYKSACVTLGKCIKTSCFAFFSSFRGVCQITFRYLSFKHKKRRPFVAGLTRDDFFACRGSIIFLSAFFIVARTWMRCFDQKSFLVMNACYRIRIEPKEKYRTSAASPWNLSSQRERYLIFLIPLFKES